jgi:hypothetical protein
MKQGQDPTLEYKKEYNALLVREKKAEAYLNDESIPLEERVAWGPAYNEICKRLGWLLQQIGGWTLKGNEVDNGFDIPVQENLFKGEGVSM